MRGREKMQVDERKKFLVTTYFLKREKETSSLMMRLDVSKENVFSLSSFLDINKVLGNDFWRMDQTDR